MADTKNVYEQLEELKEKLNEANKPRTLVEQLANDDPAVIEFVKKAKRVWRYHGEHSDFDRKIKALQKRGLILILWLLMQIAYPFLMVSIPYAWIIIAINAAICVGYGVYKGRCFFKKRSFELEYDGMQNMLCEYDDNGIVKFTKLPFVEQALKVSTFVVMPLSCVVFLILSDNLVSVAWFVSLFSLSLCSIPLTILSNSGISYVLFFVDDKNEIEYHLLKDFMKRNKLK